MVHSNGMYAASSERSQYDKINALLDVSSINMVSMRDMLMVVKIKYKYKYKCR